MTDADSIWDYCVNGLEDDLPEDTDSSMIHFANAVQNIAKDMNQFDKSKFPCAVCDQLGHTFEYCPVLRATNLKEAYLRLLLLVKRFVKGMNKFDPTGKQYNNNLNVLQNVTLEQLHALDILEDFPLHIVSSCVPITDARVDHVINMFKDDFTPLLTQHHSVISNLSSLMGSTSGVYLPIKLLLMMILLVLPILVQLLITFSTMLLTRFIPLGKIRIFGWPDKENNQ